MKQPSKGGFTLIELLVVLAIMAVIATLATPTVIGVVRGNKILQAEQMVNGVLALARQNAITKNHPVEVRFYRYAGKGNFASHVSFRALQAFDVPSPASFVPLDRVRYLPDGIILDSSSTLSSLFDSTTRGTAQAGSTSIPAAGTNYTYMFVRFLAGGSTDLLASQSPWFLTLHDESAGDNLTKPPPNFITLEIDPVAGTQKMYRP